MTKEEILHSCLDGIEGHTESLNCYCRPIDMGSVVVHPSTTKKEYDVFLKDLGVDIKDFDFNYIEAFNAIREPLKERVFNETIPVSVLFFTLKIIGYNEDYELAQILWDTLEMNNEK